MPLSCVYCKHTVYVTHTRTHTEQERVCVLVFALDDEEQRYNANYVVVYEKITHTQTHSYKWYVTHTVVVDRMDSIGTRIG